VGRIGLVAGIATRRRSLLVVLVGSQACGLAVVLVLVAAGGEPAPSAEAIGLAGAAGIVELVGFAALYAGLARAPMGVVGPVSALGGAVPLAVALVAGDLPGAWAAVGIVLALAGVALVSSERERAAGAGRDRAGARRRRGPGVRGLLLADRRGHRRR
jgi:drug/metabolite transporter (DMT)-like permease